MVTGICLGWVNDILSIIHFMRVLQKRKVTFGLIIILDLTTLSTNCSTVSWNCTNGRAQFMNKNVRCERTSEQASKYGTAGEESCAQQANKWRVDFMVIPPNVCFIHYNSYTWHLTLSSFSFFLFVLKTKKMIGLYDLLREVDRNYNFSFESKSRVHERNDCSRP